jgi:hypothetical protein
MHRQQIRKIVQDVLMEHQLTHNQIILSVEILSELLTNAFIQINLEQLNHQLASVNQDVMHLVNLLNQQLVQCEHMHSEIVSLIPVLRSQSASNVTMQMRIGNLKNHCDTWKREQIDTRKQLESTMRKSIKWYTAIERSVIAVDAMEILVKIPKDPLI